MAQENKTFDAVRTMRKIRDNLSRRFQGMTFAEQKRAMQAAQKRKPARSVRQKMGKHAT